MSGMTPEQLHRTTLGIYSTLMDEFNPSLQRLVSLGNSYIQAFQALAATSEAYFGALSRIGEKAYHTVSSRSIGDVLIQISETQRRITLEMEGVFRFFTVEVIREMENNVRLDKGYLSESRKRYEMQVHNQVAARERQLWRSQEGPGEYMHFLKSSHQEALKEEERRHRFVAEKHCSLIQSVADIMNKSGNSLQQRADAWRNEVNATRGQETRQPAPVDNFANTGMGMPRDDDIRRNREPEPVLGKVPSRAPSPVGGGRSAGGRTMRARVAHQPASSNRTLLPFSRGETVTVLVQQARNGWLFGRAERSPNPGWFPESYVEAVDDLPGSTGPRGTLRSSGSSQLDQLGSRSPAGFGGGGAPAPPPPPPPLSLGGPPQSAAPPPAVRAEPKPENKKSKPPSSQPELFPRGTNPFATVKLRPTATNDRSAPHF